jgi:acylglycerol lipase
MKCNRQSPSGHYHDLLNDLGKEKVMADINGWIDAHLAPAS